MRQGNPRKPKGLCIGLLLKLCYLINNYNADIGYTISLEHRK